LGCNEVVVLARPKFSFYQPASEKLLERLSGTEDEISSRYIGMPNFVRHDDEAAPLKPSTPGRLHPVGIDLRDKLTPIENIRNNLSARFVGEAVDKDVDRYDAELDAYSHVNGVYFPLLAVLLPKWSAMIHEFSVGGSEKILYLVSGAGKPRNRQHRTEGNSTEGTAGLMKIFVEKFFPAIKVVQVHGVGNLFRYDENVAFVNDKLCPLLEGNRKTCARQFGSDWRKRFQLTVSMSDGAPGAVVICTHAVVILYACCSYTVLKL
jgi:hypothetical protein